MPEISDGSGIETRKPRRDARGAVVALSALLLAVAAMATLGFTAIVAAALAVQVLRNRPIPWIRLTAALAILVSFVGVAWWVFLVADVADGGWCFLPDAEPACPRPGLAALWILVGVCLGAAVWYGGARALPTHAQGG
jgi:hypothetical protein